MRGGRRTAGRTCRRILVAPPTACAPLRIAVMWRCFVPLERPQRARFAKALWRRLSSDQSSYNAWSRSALRSRVSVWRCVSLITSTPHLGAFMWHAPATLGHSLLLGLGLLARGCAVIAEDSYGWAPPATLAGRRGLAEDVLHFLKPIREEDGRKTAEGVLAA